MDFSSGKAKSPYDTKDFPCKRSFLSVKRLFSRQAEKDVIYSGQNKTVGILNASLM